MRGLAPHLRRIGVAAGAAIAILLLIVFDLRLFVRDPSQSYPLFLIVTAIATRFVGARCGYATIAVSALALAFFNLEGDGFAVSDPHDAIGLIDLIAAGLVIVNVIEWLRLRVASGRRGLAAAEAREAASGALISELSHRVMNDLASLGALATLQASEADGNGDLVTRRAMTAMAERLYFLGSVYRRLQISGETATDVPAFLAGLCEDVRQVHLGMRPVSLDLEAEAVAMPFSDAALLGMMLNESVTNALKYAFPDDRPGRIVACLRHEPDGEWLRFEIVDDGVGPAAGRPRGTGLGSKLMRSIAAQLRGTYELRREPDATSSCLRFRLREAGVR